MTIDLILIGGEPRSQPWSCGDMFSVPANPSALADFVESHLSRTKADAWLFWNASHTPPDAALVEQFLESPSDVWHAGLSLGTAGLPRSIDFVSPTWMLNRDPDPSIEATSWRLSFEACLVRTEVFRQLGGPRREFRTLLGAGLEFGHRCITRGALIRHVPELAPTGLPAREGMLPAEDEIEFLLQRFAGWQPYWALFRAAMTRHMSPLKAARGMWRTRRSRCQPNRAVYVRPDRRAATPPEGSVTVLIPTLYRYPYLRTVLNQLRTQTVRPGEIIVVDQTGEDERDTSIAQDFSDLPLKVFHLDRAGQCTSRNFGLQQASGDYILFIDDDDEISDTLIESHLARIDEFDASSGVADEVGAGSLPENFTFFRTSDVFPTNNTLIKKGILLKSGLFDLAYDRGQRADGDLGMRVYLSGAQMVLDPQISVLHHHAPRGGLREHKARVITYASSRQSLTQRHLPSVSELYLTRRYFSPRQQHEGTLLRIIGTFRIEGGALKKLAKMLVSSALLPNTIFRVREAHTQAEAMLKLFPQIPALNGASNTEEHAPRHSDK